MAITDWPENERPREKLLLRGAEALSDAELLALFLRVGTQGKTAVDLARDILAHFGSLTRLCACSAADFTAIPGLGHAKYAQLQAVMELARRALAEQMHATPLLNSPQAVTDWLRLRIGALPYEVFYLLILDAQHHLIEVSEMFRGTVSQTCVYPREIIKRVLDTNGSAVIIAHNHPSGSQTPSQADQALTATLKQALATVEVKLLDHLIITAHQSPFSFAEHGLLHPAK